ncbi:MAG: helix-turn-helix domain-containing protein [Candidatus Absconditicoccaceae bacterium]
MQLHPGKKIQIELKDRGWTQRQFAFLLGKKVSEVNELIKGKRNITVQWDILLSHVLGTSRKYRLDLQNEYEYSLIESDFDISKLPNTDQKPSSPNKTIHQISEQEKKSEISLEKIKETPQNITLQEKKEEKQASQSNEDLNKAHKIDKDVDISKQQEKPQSLDDKKAPNNNKNYEKKLPSNQNSPTLDSEHKTTSPEGHPKLNSNKDKYDRQKIYNQNDKFNSYFPTKEINLDTPHKKIKKNTPALPSATPLKKEEKNLELQEKKDDHKDHHKHKEHIFRNF